MRELPANQNKHVDTRCDRLHGDDMMRESTVSIPVCMPNNNIRMPICWKAHVKLRMGQKGARQTGVVILVRCEDQSTLRPDVAHRSPAACLVWRPLPLAKVK